MKNILMSLLVLSVGSVAFAQEAKVIKVKGQQAIVTFPSGVKPQVGQTIDLGGGGVSGEEAGVGTGSSNTILGIAGELSILNNSGSSQTTTALTFNGRYGWNQETLEFGPIATISYSSSPGVSSRLIAGGGFFDFNFIPNKSGVRMVYGVGADAQFGQASTQISSASETTSTVMEFFVGGNVKYFGFADNVAIRGDIGLEYDRTTVSSTTTTVTGLDARLGLSFYY